MQMEKQVNYILLIVTSRKVNPFLDNDSYTVWSWNTSANLDFSFPDHLPRQYIGKRAV